MCGVDEGGHESDMNPSTELRDRASLLARANARSALAIARSVPAPWFRAQALAAVARWIDDFSVGIIAAESLAAAADCADDYQCAAVSAWPIRALAERGCLREANEALVTARQRALLAEPAGSRAEALHSLLEGGWLLGASHRRQLVSDLFGLQAASGHWRAARALVDALGMLAGVDRRAAEDLASTIRDEKCRTKAFAAISAGDRRPRSYF